MVQGQDLETLLDVYLVIQKGYDVEYNNAAMSETIIGTNVVYLMIST